MSHQPDAGKGDRFGDRQLVRPERVVLGGGVGGENVNCFARLDGVARERGVRHAADETGLGEGARRPALRAMTGEPLQRQVMPLVTGPEQRDEQVGVEQVPFIRPRPSRIQSVRIRVSTISPEFVSIRTFLPGEQQVHESGKSGRPPRWAGGDPCFVCMAPSNSERQPTRLSTGSSPTGG